MKREKFIKREAKRLGVTKEHLLRFHEVLPCECPDEECPGWKLNWLGPARRPEK